MATHYNPKYQETRPPNKAEHKDKPTIFFDPTPDEVKQRAQTLSDLLDEARDKIKGNQ